MLKVEYNIDMSLDLLRKGIWPDDTTERQELLEYAYKYVDYFDDTEDNKRMKKDIITKSYLDS